MVNGSNLLGGKGRRRLLVPLVQRHFQDWELGVVMQFMELIHKVRVLESGEDNLPWREERKGMFRVKSFYKSLHDENLALFLAKEI